MSKTATAEKAAISKAEFQTFEAIRACTEDVLNRFQSIPPTRYEGCFIRQDTVSARGGNLIAGRGKPPTKTSTATEKTRRHILIGVAAMICAPAIVRAASLYAGARCAIADLGSAAQDAEDDERMVPGVLLSQSRLCPKTRPRHDLHPVRRDSNLGSRRPPDCCTRAHARLARPIVDGG
jgi:hypothetical protein